jgi:hypothetical protein
MTFKTKRCVCIIDGSGWDRYKGQSLDIPKRAYTMLQLSAFWPRLGTLQAASSLPVLGVVIPIVNVHRNTTQRVS